MIRLYRLAIVIVCLLIIAVELSAHGLSYLF